MNTDPSRRHEIDVSMLTSSDVMRFEPFSRVNFSMKIEASPGCTFADKIGAQTTRTRTANAD